MPSVLLQPFIWSWHSSSFIHTLIQRTYMSPAMGEPHARLWGYKAKKFLVLEDSVGVS